MPPASIPAAVERRPAMDPQVNVRVADEGSLARLRDRLGRLQIGGQPISWHEETDGFVSMEFGQADDAIGAITVGADSHAPEALGFEIIEIEDEVASTGYHVPEGILLTYDPAAPSPAGQERAQVPTTAIAPLVLEALDVPRPAHHGAPTIGADVRPG
ncbi:MAG: hypothetical protein U5K30_12005 [Acidimicrobiales bacterium]|nr:hypothetical protein [Acidimicrobiales bacterium]